MTDIQKLVTELRDLAETFPESRVSWVTSRSADELETLANDYTDLVQRSAHGQAELSSQLTEATDQLATVADAWDEGAEFAIGYSTPPLYENPYRKTRA